MMTYQWIIGRENEYSPEIVERDYAFCPVKALTLGDGVVRAVERIRMLDVGTRGDYILSIRPEDDHSYVTVWRVVRKCACTTEVEEVLP